MHPFHPRAISRRALLKTGGLLGALGLGAATAPIKAQTDGAGPVPYSGSSSAHAHGAGQDEGANSVVGSVDHERNGFDPWTIATEFDFGVVSEENGRRVREFTLTAIDQNIEIAPGIIFPAWTFNGRVPGPSLRCVEGDLLRIRLLNAGSHSHSLHFHGIHSARMDGVAGASIVAPGGEFVYEFDARPFGVHLYHCHVIPLKRHIHKGMYGTFIIDPDPERHPAEAAAAQGRLFGTPEHARWQEFVIVMNGFDTDFDDENEFYAANSIPFAYVERPLRLDRTRPVRLYVVNLTEFDPINSFHLHGNFFDYYDHGTTLAPTLRTVDTIMQCQGQRGILEFSYGEHEPGLYMFHAHQSEFAELGWMSHFEVV